MDDWIDGWVGIKDIRPKTSWINYPKCLSNNSHVSPRLLCYLELKPNHPFIQQSTHPSSCGMILKQKPTQIRGIFAPKHQPSCNRIAWTP